MPSVVTTSIVVQFSQGDQAGVLSVEVDDRPNGLNGGKTSFLPGLPVWLLLYKTANVTLDTPVVSLSTLSGPSPSNGVTIQKTEDITFAGESTATARYPIVGDIDVQWIGNNLGNIDVSGEVNLTLTDPEPGDKPVGIARITYNTKAYPYRINQHTPPTGLTEYSIVAFFSGSTP